MWFVCSADDTTDSAFIYDLPTYAALIQAGAQHCYITLFETAGHFVWVPFFQNTITGVQDPTAVADITIPSARDSVLSAYNMIPDDETGGAFTADGYDNIFAWLNAQSK